MYIIVYYSITDHTTLVTIIITNQKETHASSKHRDLSIENVDVANFANGKMDR